MAERAGVSASTVGRIWRTFGLQPHVVESFKISDDPLFIEKVRDIVGLYLNPPDHAVVLSFDEKPQIQALERAQPILPMDWVGPNARRTTTSAMARWTSSRRSTSRPARSWRKPRSSIGRGIS